MTNLRERNKKDRRNRILDAARQNFLEHGFENATIDSIAAIADVSAVTIYNYYGTKGGLLLALAARSGQILIEKIKNVAPKPAKTSMDALDALCRLSTTVNDHALADLGRAIWRHTIATSIVEGRPELGHDYFRIARELKALLCGCVATPERRRRDGGRGHPSPGEIFYNIHNARFIQFITDTSIPREMLDVLVRRDYAFILDVPYTDA
ncbi:TetR/AcrR family transcriptional regulator [Varunaivibrio sulfuroxidans]|uniref:TetR family transcriptional regulator n=1 Tax=Varunaivibrio sulfuroxidans TaxID=1773489 RepID=A0A4R3J9D6_9PROT|nr:TetR/AcrR family transcriptional regulator [Varunaivibrio sulfuroxidans]TCS62117.1 TetR family transcriptional regulator [Varunaivibrio sulfuroxidans]WES30550.1 TetR/AcrR family transcriptional regulator [Varunaivibrio sulfuroxidans]